jgi:hypothetical protein
LKRKRAPQDEDADYKPEREQYDDQGEDLRPKGQRGFSKQNMATNQDEDEQKIMVEERLATLQKRSEYFMTKASDKGVRKSFTDGGPP